MDRNVMKLEKPYIKRRPKSCHKSRGFWQWSECYEL